ncbi:MAG: SGNH/GDSL hydrolase family protein [Fimbriimonas sp.]
MFALPPVPAEAPLRVLFVGNSYTYGNNLPALIQRISELTPGRKVVAEQVTEGGWSLQLHWLRGKAPGRVREGKWDYVVLQDHSLRPIDDRPQFERFSRLFVHAVRKQGGRPLFYMTWARRHRPETQATLTNAYRRIAVEQKAALAPVGEAWREILSGPEPRRLHLGDDSHANAEGSYVAALTILAVVRERILETSPVELAGIKDLRPTASVVNIHLEESVAARFRAAVVKALAAEPRRHIP